MGGEADIYRTQRESVLAVFKFAENAQDPAHFPDGADFGRALREIATKARR